MVDHKKISLSPEDLKKLQTLLANAEVSVDAMSDAELEAEEKALEARIRNLPQMQKSSTSSQEKDEIQASWQKLQKELDPARREEIGAKSEKDNVVAFAKPQKKSTPWTAIGVMAAAALALFVFYPTLKNDDRGSVDPNNLLTKGTDSSGAHVYTGYCEVDVRGPSVNDVEEAGVGKGYEVDPSANFSISVSCEKSGYIQVWSNSSPAPMIRNTKVEANVRSFVVEDGKPVEFSLSGTPLIILNIALTDKDISPQTNLLDVAIPAQRIGDAVVTWTDSLVFREKN